MISETSVSIQSEVLDVKLTDRYTDMASLMRLVSIEVTPDMHGSILDAD